MILEGLVVGMFQSNCYIAGWEATGEAMIVDPGDESKRILATLERLKLKVKIIVCTHTHIDHVGALQEMRETTGASVAMHRDAFESSRHDSGVTELLLGAKPRPFGEPDVFLEDGDKVTVGGLEFEVLFCPGHAFGHICLYGEGVVFTGDALFQGGIGRFDLPGGDGKQLLHGIRERLLTLSDDTVVLAGHGPSSTIGEEKSHNPFLLYPRMYMGIDPD
ncbi:MAG: MBL fold metallo-hydrolase [Dehalococcoidia bacterium]|jgi:glyoxylase-like metal-dependent hydrolase (beta-lactamase superfamily II)